MKGIITSINQNRGMFAIQTASGYSIAELLSGEDIDLGDELQWNGTSPLGDTEVRNITKDEKFSIYFQNHEVSAANLYQQLLF